MGEVGDAGNGEMRKGMGMEDTELGRGCRGEPQIGGSLGVGGPMIGGDSDFWGAPEVDWSWRGPKGD